MAFKMSLYASDSHSYVFFLLPMPSCFLDYLYLYVSYTGISNSIAQKRPHFPSSLPFPTSSISVNAPRSHSLHHPSLISHIWSYNSPRSQSSQIQLLIHISLACHHQFHWPLQRVPEWTPASLLLLNKFLVIFLEICVWLCHSPTWTLPRLCTALMGWYLYQILLALSDLALGSSTVLLCTVSLSKLVPHQFSFSFWYPATSFFVSFLTHFLSLECYSHPHLAAENLSLCGTFRDAGPDIWLFLLIEL